MYANRKIVKEGACNFVFFFFISFFPVLFQIPSSRLTDKNLWVSIRKGDERMAKGVRKIFRQLLTSKTDTGTDIHFTSTCLLVALSMSTGA